ncbi:hypothetical protein [Streptomyces malaysiensis]
MAEVTKSTKTVVKTVIDLTLSEEEAEVLAVVLGAVAGGEDDTPRGLTQGVLNALESAGVSWYRTETSRKMLGSIRFYATPAAAQSARSTTN